MDSCRRYTHPNLMCRAAIKQDGRRWQAQPPRPPAARRVRRRTSGAVRDVDDRRGMLLRGLYVTHTVDTGFEYRDVAFVSLESVAGRSRDPKRPRHFVDVCWAEVEALPGVTAAAYTDRQPWDWTTPAIQIRLPRKREDIPNDQLVSVTPQYFSVLGAAGRARKNVHSTSKSKTGQPACSRHRE